MRSSRRCSLASLVSVVCLAASASAAEDPPLVRLSLVDLQGLAADVRAGASAEAAAVLDRLGARVEVRSKRPSDPHDPRDLLIVVMPGHPGPLLARTVMGAVQRDAPTRALWVFPLTIAAALDLPADPAAWTAEDRVRFATGLGRVMAHEIVHLTCPWRDHDRSGLMAARMSRSTLRGGTLEVEDALRRDFVLGASAQAGRPRLVARVTDPVD